MRELALAYSLQHLQLLLGELDVLVIQLIVDGAPEFGVIVACQQAVQVALPLALGELASGTIIPDMLLVVIPVQGHITDCRHAHVSGYSTSEPLTGHPALTGHASRLGR